MPGQAGVVDASGIGQTKNYGGPCHDTKTAVKPEESVKGFYQSLAMFICLC